MSCRRRQILPSCSSCRGLVRGIPFFAAFAVLLGRMPSFANEGAAKRAFTVRDSIEMSYIVDPARVTAISIRGEQPVGVPIYSPDEKYFLLVTQSGRVSTNTLQGTIWLFDRHEVWNYVLGKSHTAAAPRKLVTMSAVSNTPVVYDVRWIGGSKKVTFLGKDGSSYQRLFSIDVETASVTALTKEDVFVTAYDIRGDTIAYTVLLKEPQAAGFDRDIVDVGQKCLSVTVSKSACIGRHRGILPPEISEFLAGTEGRTRCAD